MSERRGDRVRGQSGSTLIEVVLVVGLSALIAVPMFGWAMVGMRQQTAVMDRNVAGTSLGLLRAAFFADVTSAVAASTDADDGPLCGADQGVKDPVVLLEQPSGTVVYGIGTGEDGGRSLWRVECPAGSTKALGTAEMVQSVLPAMTSASCAAGADRVGADGNVSDDRAGDAGARGHAAHDNAADIAKEKTEGKGPQRGGADGTGTRDEPDDALLDTCGTVTLRVTTDAFQQTVMTASLRVGSVGESVLDPPTAAATADPVSGARALKVQFSSDGSKDPYGEPLEHRWDFGDGTSSTEANPTHVFVSVGTTTVTLTVTSTAGLSAAATVEVEVLDNAPVAVIASPEPGTTTHRGTTVAFSSVGSNDDLDGEWGGRIVAHEWDFGDGTSSVEANPTKAYADPSPPGGYLVTLTVTDDAGGRASAQTTVVVTNRVPTVSIAASPASGSSPLTVSFSAVVVDEPDMSPAPPVSYAWELGDGLTSTAATPPPVTYTGQGNRTIRLTVTDDVGATATATTTVAVGAGGIGPPRGLRATNSGNEQGNRFIELAWDRVEGANRYEVFLRCESCDETASGSESGTTVRIRGLSSGRKWYLASVRARSAVTGQWGPWSDEVRVRS